MERRYGWRFVPAGWHGALDYGAAAALMAAPSLIGLSPGARAVSMAAGIVLVVYSLLTDYALGVARALSVRMHLAFDCAAGVGLLAAPFLLGTDGPATTYFTVMALGVFAAVAVTNPDPVSDRSNSMIASKAMKTAALALALTATPFLARAAAPTAHSTVGAGGYDLVSYHTGKKPLPGNGNHVVVRDGVTYLFASEENKDAFSKAPERYLPAYGGWCAYGVSVGKKFVGDPTVWEIVDGRLYLNLDNGIKARWAKDIPGNVAKADATWPKIQDREPGDL